MGEKRPLTSPPANKRNKVGIRYRLENADAASDGVDHDVDDDDDFNLFRGEHDRVSWEKHWRERKRLHDERKKARHEKRMLMHRRHDHKNDDVELDGDVDADDVQLEDNGYLCASVSSCFSQGF